MGKKQSGEGTGPSSIVYGPRAAEDRLASPLKIPVAEKWNQGRKGNLACGRVQGSEKSQEVRPREPKKKTN